MSFENDYLDVLQNIEFAIVNFCRRHRELCDYDVMRTLEALIRCFPRRKSRATATRV